MIPETTESLSFSEKTLLLDFETPSLDVYSWEHLDAISGKSIFLFVFSGDFIRLIKLDKTDPVVRCVKSKTHEAKVKILTDSDVALYMEDAKEFLNKHEM